VMKGTPWSWLPFAVGIPVLPVFGWAGATGGLTPMFAVLVPAGIAAGAALSISNSLVDKERDREAGVTSVALALGEGTARAVAFALLVMIALAAATSVLAFGGGWPAALVVGLLGCVPPVAARLASPADRAAPPESARLEVVWRVQAIGLAALAVAWIAAVTR
jgi:4-hydroxybenzoate polyprenyltransferase